jgi:WD40 repeat protein
MMISGCSANTLKFWDMRDLRRSLGSISWHRSGIRALAFSPNAKIVASGGQDQTVKLWDLSTRRQLGSFSFPHPVRHVVFSPTGRELAVVTDQGSLHLLSTSSLQEADKEMRTFYSPR